MNIFSCVSPCWFVSCQDFWTNAVLVLLFVSGTERVNFSAVHGYRSGCFCHSALVCHRHLWCLLVSCVRSCIHAYYVRLFVIRVLL